MRRAAPAASKAQAKDRRVDDSCSDSDIQGQPGGGPNAGARDAEPWAVAPVPVQVGDAVDMHSHLYKPCESIEMRFLGLNRVALQDAVFNVYTAPGKRGITVPWYDSNGDKTMVPHIQNERKQDQVVQECAEKVAEFGNVPGVRGQPWCTLHTSGGFPLQMLTYGTLTQAFYLAADMERKANVFEDEPGPDNDYIVNPCIKLSLQKGLPNVTCFNAETPRDVVDWLVNWHNHWHSGSSFTVIQLFDWCKKLNTDFKATKLTDTPYASSWEYASAKYATTATRRFSSENEIKALLGTLKRHQLLTWTVEFLGKYCKFTEERFSNAAVVFNLHAVSVALFSSEVRSGLSMELVAEIWKVAVEFIVPTAGLPGRSKPWLFDESQIDMRAKQLAEMTQLAAETAKADAQKAAVNAAELEAQGENPPPAKKPKVAPAGRPPVESLTDLEMQKIWVVDAALCLISAMSDADLDDDGQWAIFRSLMSMGLEFCWAKVVQLGQVKYTKWSELRCKLRDVAASSAYNLQLGNSSTTTASDVLEWDAETDGQGAPEPQPSATCDEPTAPTRLESAIAAAGAELDRFLMANKLTAPAKLRPAHRSINKRMFDLLGESQGQLLADKSRSDDAGPFVAHLLGLMTDILTAEISEAMLGIGQLAVRYVRQTSQLPGVVMKYFKDTPALITFARLRATYAKLLLTDVMDVQEMFHDATGMGGAVQGAAPAIKLEVLKGCLDNLDGLRDVDPILPYSDWASVHTEYLVALYIGADPDSTLRGLVESRRVPGTPTSSAPSPSGESSQAPTFQAQTQQQPQSFHVVQQQMTTEQPPHPLAMLQGVYACRRRCMGERAMSLAAGSPINLDTVRRGGAGATITFDMSRFPPAWWIKQFLMLVEAELYSRSFSARAVAPSGSTRMGWAAPAPAAKAKAKAKPNLAKEHEKPSMTVALDSDFSMCFCGPVTLTRPPAGRSFPVAAIKVTAPDSRDDTTIGVYCVADTVGTVNNECPCPAWLLRVVDDDDQATLEMKAQVVTIDLPPHLVFEGMLVPVRAFVGREVQLTRHEIPTDLPPKRKAARHANAAPADASALFGPTAAAAYMAAHPARPGSATTQQQPAAGSRSTKNKDCKHLFE
ncbi:unnamed protein product [Prorocentrum cordatum]|uniref:Rab3 GTPase-activating protein catalytic subunit n=1 Tax=Prorocentrum cordatum TaxID=2364126 RepID=A0ABN9PBB1_9DINO|nr:unnamed protein product [Polarella glacialis]